MIAVSSEPERRAARVQREDTRPEEWVNASLHMAGAGLAIAGLVLMVVRATGLGAKAVVGCSVFGSTLILTYVSSTLCHALKDGRAKDVFNVIDHASIFLLIAGTYTPFMLVTIGGAWGWSIFGVQWGLAAVGVGLMALRIDRFPRLKVSIYLGMGWLLLVAIKPLWSRMSPMGLTWLLIGGSCYSLGVVFFLWRRIPFGHAVWHLFVIGGSISHFFAALYYLPPATL